MKVCTGIGNIETMKLEFDTQELDKLDDVLALKVVERLRPLLRPPQGQDGGRIFTVEALAQYLGVKREWVYSNMRYIPHYKVGRFPRFRKAEIDRWLDSQKAPQYHILVKKAYTIPLLPKLKGHNYQ